jgi:hypothetical protein
MSMQFANEYAQCDVFASNPLGWPLDPDELVQRFPAGDSLADLMSVGREHVPDRSWQ